MRDSAKQRLATATRPARAVFRREVGAAVSDAVGPGQAGFEAEIADLRRVLTDDMDASNEATAVFGRQLARLSERLDGVEDQLAQILERLDAPKAAAARRRAARPEPED